MEADAQQRTVHLETRKPVAVLVDGVDQHRGTHVSFRSRSVLYLATVDAVCVVA